ncbi:MAG: signal recognition particle receptor subunit alpha, partial [Acidobacteriota bacterium]|nr:signal recognition particle receptor subunit alpha [Acidobacteriota bacterium]
MGIFWKRKKEDRFITLGLNELVDAPPAAVDQAANQVIDEAARTDRQLEPPAATMPGVAALDVPSPPLIDSAITGAASTPSPALEPKRVAPPATPMRADHSVPPTTAAPRPVPPPRPVPSRSPFTTSVLGLDRSIEDLQAEEAALEQALAARFSRAISATRESLSEKIDTVFQGRKQIDAELLDQLEEALVAADIGVPTTLEILDTVRRGIARKQINDIDALKLAIKNELLVILRESERQGVASEASVPESVSPYVLMIVGVNGVGKTTTIGKLAQRIKAEGNDVLICAADTFRAA